MKKHFAGLHFAGELVMLHGWMYKLIKPANRPMLRGEIFFKDITWDVIRMDTSDEKWRRPEVKGVHFKRHTYHPAPRVKCEIPLKYKSV